MLNEGHPVRGFLQGLFESRKLRSNFCRVPQQPDWMAFVMPVFEQTGSSVTLRQRVIS